MQVSDDAKKRCQAQLFFATTKIRDYHSNEKTCNIEY